MTREEMLKWFDSMKPPKLIVDKVQAIAGEQIIIKKSDTMMEHKKEMIAFQISKPCPDCFKGYMEAMSGGTMLSNPPLYPHQCTLCGHNESYHRVYPYIGYEPKENVNP